MNTIFQKIFLEGISGHLIQLQIKFDFKILSVYQFLLWCITLQILWMVNFSTAHYYVTDYTHNFSRLWGILHHRIKKKNKLDTKAQKKNIKNPWAGLFHPLNVGSTLPQDSWNTHHVQLKILKKSIYSKYFMIFSVFPESNFYCGLAF